LHIGHESRTTIGWCSQSTAVGVVAIPRHEQPIFLHANIGIFGRAVVDC
jgi:hypothetical protein